MLNRIKERMIKLLGAMTTATVRILVRLKGRKKLNMMIGLTKTKKKMVKRREKIRKNINIANTKTRQRRVVAGMNMTGKMMTTKKATRKKRTKWTTS